MPRLLSLLKEDNYGFQVEECLYPQRLSTKGERVENTLANFREEVNPPYFTTGHVDGCCPSLKITFSETELIFQHPYPSGEELYPIAEQSQVGTTKETVYRLDARKSREFSKVDVLNKSWKDAVCGQIRDIMAPGAMKVNAELYKLLVYREGDFFHQYQDAHTHVCHSVGVFARTNQGIGEI